MVHGSLPVVCARAREPGVPSAPLQSLCKVTLALLPPTGAHYGCHAVRTYSGKEHATSYEENIWLSSNFCYHQMVQIAFNACGLLVRITAVVRVRVM